MRTISGELRSDGHEFNREADAGLIAELCRRPGQGAYDEEPIATLNCEALDFVAASQSFTLRLEPDAPAQANSADTQVLAFLDVSTGRSTAELAKHLGRTTRATQQRLARLEQSGMVVVVGTGPRDPQRRWFSGPQAPTARNRQD